ncbi:MAG: hypothetical protein ACXWTN_06325 [Methylosarcina sp.]
MRNKIRASTYVETPIQCPAKPAREREDKILRAEDFEDILGALESPVSKPRGFHDQPETMAYRILVIDDKNTGFSTHVAKGKVKWILIPMLAFCPRFGVAFKPEGFAF